MALGISYILAAFGRVLCQDRPKQLLIYLSLLLMLLSRFIVWHYLACTFLNAIIHVGANQWPDSCWQISNYAFCINLWFIEYIQCFTFMLLLVGWCSSCYISTEANCRLSASFLYEKLLLNGYSWSLLCNWLDTFYHFNLHQIGHKLFSLIAIIVVKLVIRLS